MEYPNTREEAKKIGAKYYFTGQPCKHGHVALRKTKGSCIECLKIEWEKESVDSDTEYDIHTDEIKPKRGRKPKA